ncbi:uncharacterized protein WM294_015149 [Sarcoramphus papa]
MWEVMFSRPQTLEKVLKELFITLQDQHNRLFYTYPEDTCILRLALLASDDLEDEEFAPLYNCWRFLRHPSPAMLSLVLTGLITLSQRAQMVSLIWEPEPRRRALGNDSCPSAQPSEFLKWKKLRHLVQTQQTWRIADPEPTACTCILVPGPQQQSRQGLFSTPLSPPCTQREGGLSATGGAGRRLCSGQLGRLCDTPIPLCSLQLVQDRSRAEEYLKQSLPYLEDAQAPLREAAVRFIGLAVRPLRDQSEEKLAEVCHALRTLEKDSEPSIYSLAYQTILILGSPKVQQTSRRSLRALCCWCC